MCDKWRMDRKQDKNVREKSKCMRKRKSFCKRMEMNENGRNK